MKTKLTLSVDARTVQRAKAAARQRGVPLSRLVEEHFERMAAPGGRHDSATFFTRWRGAFRLKDSRRRDERAAAIAAKHLR